jgi:adenylate cyclase, class 2
VAKWELAARSASRQPRSASWTLTSPAYREEWRWGEVAFDFDTWPGLPTFVEIEGPNEAAVRQAAATLGLDYSQARFGSVDEIYKSELGRDILAEPTLLFASTDDDGGPADIPSGR